jgi:hypothetical protein
MGTPPTVKIKVKVRTGRKGGGKVMLKRHEKTCYLQARGVRGRIIGRSGRWRRRKAGGTILGCLLSRQGNQRRNIGGYRKGSDRWSFDQLNRARRLHRHGVFFIALEPGILKCSLELLVSKGVIVGRRGRGFLGRDTSTDCSHLVRSSLPTHPDILHVLMKVLHGHLFLS